MGVSLSIWGIDKRAENELEREAMKLRKQGFTLVEIMIVVSLVGLLATISVPALPAQSRSRASKRLYQQSTTHSRRQGAMDSNRRRY